LFEKVLIPTSVVRELTDPRAPGVVRAWALELPQWVEVRTVGPSQDEAVTSLGAGERDAILLAEDIGADVLLIDELKGRAVARRRGLITTGILGILGAAGQRGLLDPVEEFERLVSETTFRSHSTLRARFLAVVDRPSSWEK
jgi:predicted nucleic acid-binding protein